MDVLGPWPLSEVAPLIQAADAQQKPIVFVGTGTERLQREESKRIVSQMLGPRVLHWSVRSARDRDRLIEYNVPGEKITEAADLAWTLDTVPANFGEKYLRNLGLDMSDSLVGVNINNESHMMVIEPLFFEKLAKFLDTLIEEHHVHILFFCNEVREGDSFDKAASQRVIGSMKHPAKALLVPNNYWSPQQMLSFIACCLMTVSTRYHFCLFSALQNVPFIALKRSDKVEDLCWDLNWPYAMSLCHLSPSALIDMFSEIKDNLHRLIEGLHQGVRLMRVRALQNTVALNALSNRIGK
jgi:polysaccharide pyruvyl transferase WcaK-like protein